MIPAALVIEKVREIALETPKIVYRDTFDQTKSCRYRDDPSVPGSGCIIGRAIDKCNPALYDSRLEGKSVLNLCGKIIDASYPEEQWLTKVQALQDSGTSWGDAIRKADSILGKQGSST